MNRRRRHARVFRWLLLLVSIVARAPAAEWLRLEADDVTVLAEVPRKDATEFTIGYLAYRHTFRELFANPDQPSPPVRILLFQNHDSISLLRAGQPSQFRIDTGFSALVDGEVVLALALNDSRRDALMAAFEFDTMSSLQRGGKFLPFWIVQGTADVLASLKVADGYCVIGQPWDPVENQARHEKWLPWSKIGAMNPLTEDYHVAATFNPFAGQAWALMRLILLRPPADARARFASLAQISKATPSPDAAAAKVLGLEPAAVTGEAQRFIRQRATLQIPFDEAAARSRLEIGPAPSWEVAVRKATIMQAAFRYEAAAAELATAVNEAPDRIPVLEARARQERSSYHLDAAAEYYRAAVAAGARNPKALLFSAQVRLDSISTLDEAGRGGIFTAEAVDEIHRALAMDPGDGEAYALLGRALFNRDKISSADLEEITPGLGSPEYGATVRYYRALIEVRLGRHEESVQDIKIALTNPSVPAAKRKSMLDGFVNIRTGWISDHIAPMVNARKYQEALALIDDMLDPDAWNFAAAQRQSLREWVEAAAALDRIRQLAQDNQAEALRSAEQDFVTRFPKQPAAIKFRTELQAGASGSPPDQK